jgi:hypothetical protein
MSTTINGRRCKPLLTGWILGVMLAATTATAQLQPQTNSRRLWMAMGGGGDKKQGAGKEVVAWSCLELVTDPKHLTFVLFPRIGNLNTTCSISSLAIFVLLLALYRYLSYN